MPTSRCVDVFLGCDRAIDRGVLIERVGKDKEFHFQNWFQRVLDTLKLHYDEPARNTYPDYRIVEPSEGYEIKALAYPGREANYDCNSQVPSGYHNGRSIFYVFGRYPKDPGGDSYPVIDLVVCHGDFLNADHEYVHKNRHVQGFGTYGDIMIRDRKMYVAPTPFALTNGTTGRRTLILPQGTPADLRVRAVGTLERTETDRVLTGYSFDLKKNVIMPRDIANPHAGRSHRFVAYRVADEDDTEVSMRESVELPEPDDE
jgi:hypothetical protein